MNVNPFDQLDAQSPESHFAQFTPEEAAEYEAWLDEVAYAQEQQSKE